MWTKTVDYWADRAHGNHLHAVRFEDLVGGEEVALRTLRGLANFLTPGISAARLRCTRAAVTALSRGIHRPKKYVPAYTESQADMIDTALTTLGRKRCGANFCSKKKKNSGTNNNNPASNNLCWALESYCNTAHIN